MQDKRNDQQGRSLDQVTKDGTSSAGTMGTGGTGRSDTDKGYDEAAHTPWVGSQQSARTDDLLSDGSDADQNGEGFAGNRQSGDREAQSLSEEGRPSDPTGLQGADGNRQSGG